MTAMDLTTQPPHSREAEQVVIGSLIVSPPLIGDVLNVITPDDFYDPRHATIVEALHWLSDEGHPVELAALITRLRDIGELEKVGGREYLAHVFGQASPPSAMYYTELIAEKSAKRQIMNLHMKGMHAAQDGNGTDLKTLVGETQLALDEISERRVSNEVVRVGQTLATTFDKIEELGKTGGGVTGIPTGFYELDRLTYGLHPGQMIVVAARPGQGKALALDTLLPTPTGWTTMGEAGVGDLLIDRTGRPTRVTAATEVMTGRPCFEVTFSDGEVIVADAEHQWFTQTRADRRSKKNASGGVRTTRELAETLRVGSDDRANHSVPLTEGLDLPDVDLLIAPYTLGAWLGDGTSAGNGFTSETSEIPMMIEADGYIVKHHDAFRYGILLTEEQPAAPDPRPCEVCGTDFTPRTVHVRTCGRVCGGRLGRPGIRAELAGCADCGKPYSGGGYCQKCYLDNHTFKGHLRTLGVLNNKHIPSTYLRASEAQRRALLAGLLDTDGYVKRCGSIGLDLTDKQLADDAYELITSLGYRVARTTKCVKGRTEATSTLYKMSFATPDPVFRLSRKIEALQQRRGGRAHLANKRYIVNVQPIESVPVRCVEVDNDEHLYLAGRAMVPTHNSTLGLDFVRSAAIKHKLPSAIFSLEMSVEEMNMRLLSAECGVELNHIRSGKMTESDWAKLARKQETIAAAPLFLDDTAGNTMSQIRQKSRRIKQRHGLNLIVIDYLQLMTGDRRSDSRQQEVSEISRSIKLLAKELEVPVIAMSQLNRGAESRTDNRPKVSDLRESGSIEQDADVVMLIHREEVYDPETVRAGEADIILGKQRSAPQGVAVLGWQGAFSRFADMSRAEEPTY